MNANSKEEVGVLQCVQCMSNGEWRARMFKCNITLSGERELSVNVVMVVFWICCPETCCSGSCASEHRLQKNLGFNIVVKENQTCGSSTKGTCHFIQPLTEIKNK